MRAAAIGGKLSRYIKEAPMAGTDQLEEERRKGPKDRRTTKSERRNPERIADEIAPRRHPDVKDRRLKS